MNITIKNIDSTVRETFSTNATEEDILWTIKVHENRDDLICLWDRNRITSEIGWVSYHLRRAGFSIEEKVKEEPTYVQIVKPLEMIIE